MVTKIEQAQKVITKIRKQYGIREDGSQNEQFSFIARNLKNSIEQLSTGLYEKDIHFILELIQNAEDNKYKNNVAPELRFVVLEEDPTATSGSDGCLCVFNNEMGFEEKHVESISQIGASTKEKARGYIGEKGIGFKSVFIVSETPHIFSNGFQFKFKEDDPEIELSYVVPYWINEPPRVLQKKSQFGTAIILPLKPGKKEEIVEELNRIEPETILFLTMLEGLSVEIEAESLTIELIRDLSNAPIIDLLIQKNGEQTSLDRYWLHSEQVTVPDSVVEAKRPNVSERLISIAFPLEIERSRGGIFAFLPTEVKSGFPFLVNADFILTANRESIQTGSKWNVWLRDSIAGLVIHGLLEILKNKKYRKQFYGFIPLEKDLLTLRTLFYPVVEEIQSNLSQMKIVLTDSGEFALPKDTWSASNSARKIFGGEIRAEIFNQFSFVDPDIEKYRPRLKAIGVKNFKAEDVFKCLNDVSWLTKNDATWFYSLYDYLKLNSANLSKQELSKLPIVLTQDEGCVSSKTQQVYFPFDGDLTKKLDGQISATNLPKISFVQNNLYSRLLANKDLYRWVGQYLDIPRFSISAYIKGTLVPWLNEHITQLEERDLLLSVELILENWQDLSEDDKEAVGDQLPTLLDDGSIVNQGKAKSKELMVPRSLDKQKGWQLFLKAEEDFEHLDILSDKYLSIDGADREKLQDFFDQIDAQSFPDLHEASFANTPQSYGHYKEYVSNIFEAFDEHSTIIPKIHTWVTPSFFHNEAQRNNRKSRFAFFHWLEGMLENRQTSLGNGQISWYFRTQKVTKVESCLYFYLTHTPWIRTTKGLKRPGEVFRKTKQINEMFGGRLAYLKDDISPELCEFLGIKSEVNTDTVLAYLLELSSDSEASIQLVKLLYKYLDDYGDDFVDSFNDEALIFLPGTEKYWHTASEVIWEDATDALGNMYGWLSPVYETSDLKQFFVEQIEINESVEHEDLARAWLTLPEQENLEPENVKASLTIIFPRMLSAAKSEDTSSSWWNDFVEDVLVWTQDDEFIDKNSVYASDDQKLGSLFSDHLYYFWKPDNLTHNDLNPLYKELGISRLSECIQVSLEDPGKAKGVHPPRFLTSYSKHLICYLIYNDSPEKYENLKESGTLKGLLQSTESITDSLVITYEVVDRDVDKKIADRHAFWELDKQVLYLRSAADNEDLLDDVVEVIARRIWGARFKQHEDHVRTLLAISTIERFRKLRGNKGWNLPPAINREVTKLIEGSGQRSLEIDSSSEQRATEPDTNESTAEHAEPSNDSDSASDPSDVAIDLVNQFTPPVLEQKAVEEIDSTNQQTQTRTQSRPEESSVSRHRTFTQHDTNQSRRNSTKNRVSDPSRFLDRSRSRSTTNKINLNNQRRIVTYVYSQKEKQKDSDQNAWEKQAERDAIGNAAEEFVCEYEEQKGRKALRMPAGNAGYDIESTDPETGALSFIEVKGMDGVWGERGVGMTYTQYEKARVENTSYWLYVVEYARSEKPVVHRINDPAELITEYRFDSNWAAIAARDLVQIAHAETPEGLIQELLSLTDFESCKSIIEFCGNNNLSVPEVGYELVNEQDEVVAEFELAWADRKVAVLVDEEAVVDFPDHQDWKFISSLEIESNLNSLKDILEVDYA